MIAAERMRVRFVFGGLAVVPLFLTGWLGYVQVLQGLMFVVLLVSETLYGRIPFFRPKGDKR